MDTAELKELLKNIEANAYAVPRGYHASQLSQAMMEHIGDIDSEIRDDLILYTLFRWITEGVLSATEVNSLLAAAIDEEHLLKGLGGVDDSVFCRTFLVEVVAYAIRRHRREPFITQNGFRKAFDAVLEFYDEDDDVRGFVDGKGWAHGAAHGADALAEFACCDEITHDDLTRILYSVQKKASIGHYSYIHFEDERMATASVAVLDRGVIPLNEIEDWIRGFGITEKTGEYLKDMASEFNRCSFLKSLYFRLADRTEHREEARIVKETLKNASRFGKL